jgi:hypothetical protein
VERAFRTLKSVDLQIRRVHHWIEPRVRAHVFLCMLAYYVEWHLRDAWEPILFHDHDHATAEQERASPVAPAELSTAALRKPGRRRTDSGLPLSSFGDLMARLATQTMNVVAMSGATEAAFTTVTKQPPSKRQPSSSSRSNRYVSSSCQHHHQKSAHINSTLGVLSVKTSGLTDGVVSSPCE